MSYQKDTTYNLFYRPDAGAIGYSEGEAAEQRLLDIVESVTDRSVCSTELLERIDDWSTRYHFSRARHCLLRPLGIKAGDRVLELGCGAGAITRYLGEIGAEVTAVEGSLARARVAAARCHDLPNVTIIADDLQVADVKGQYDWVTLIGVFEYAGAYSDAEDPYQSYLAAAMRSLQPGGKVIVAIENQLGLKYFNGCAEDHLGVPFAGIQDLYTPRRGVRTFGRRVLSELLSRAGLHDQQWMYPYPDYKIPNLVLTDEALQHPVFDAADLLVRSDSEDYGGNTLRLFDEGLVNRVLADNGLLADFSNSFLIVASRPEARNAQKNWHPAALAWTFSVTSRQPGHWTETTFKAEGKEHIRVGKRQLNPEAANCMPLFEGETICLEPADSDYVQARQLTWRVLDAHVRSGSLEAIVAALKPWCEALLIKATQESSPLICVAEAPNLSGQADPPMPGKENEQANAAVPVRNLSLPGDAIDQTPFNILLDKQGKQYLIDQEWIASCRVPAGWVVTRGTFHALHVGTAPKDKLDSIAQVVIALLNACGYGATQDDIQRWMEMESRFLGVLTGASQPLMLSASTQRPYPLMRERIDSLRAEIHYLHEKYQYSVAEAERLRAWGQDSVAEAERLRAWGQDSVAEVERLRAWGQDSQAELERLRAWGQEMQKSISWRITAPVRYIEALVHQMRRR